MLLYALALIGSFFVLLTCGHLFVTGSVGIAERSHIPKIIIGTLLVSIGTTLPELAVSVQSAILGHTHLALGNAIGSVVADDALAFGMAASLAPLPFLVNKKLIKSSALVLVASATLVYFFALDGVISRFEGLVLLLALAFYFTWSIFQAKRQRRIIMADMPFSSSPPAQTQSNTRLSIQFIAGLVGVLVSSRGVIWAATGISRLFGISEIIIGLTVVAIGTSLPEVTTCVIAALKREGDIAAGNIIGADILNILWIIGMSAAAHPLIAQTRTTHFYCAALIVIVLIFLSILLFPKKIRKLHGVLLLTFYTLFLIISYYFFIR